MVDKRKLIGLYKDRGTWTNLYTRIKFKICPLLPIEPLLPKRGRVLDLGCGNGLFSAILKFGSPERRITGLDLDAGKIAVAREAFREWPEDAFLVGDVVAADYPAADIITIIDVLYLIPRPAQETILRKCRAALPPGGLLALKEMDTRPFWKYAFNMAEETLAVKIIGFTLGGRFAYRSRADMTALLERTGFEVEAVPLDKGYWYPHILYLARKK